MSTSSLSVRRHSYQRIAAAPIFDNYFLGCSIVEDCHPDKYVNIWEATMNSVNTQRSFKTLVNDLTRHTSELVRQTAKLAQAELSEKVSQARSGLVALAFGATSLLVCLVYVLDAAARALAEVLPQGYAPWLAALVVGVAAGGIGFLLIQKGRSDLRQQKLTFDRTLESLKRDTEVIKARVR